MSRGFDVHGHVGRAERLADRTLGGVREIPFDAAGDLVFHRDTALPFHPNGLRFTAVGDDGNETAETYFSIGGGFMLLAYALYRKDPVFIIGQAFGVFVYLRNLQFVMRSGGAAAI